jgi:hypothetical protein
MSEVANRTALPAERKLPPGAGLVGAACAAAQPLVPVPVPSNNSSAMQFFAPDPNEDRDAVSSALLILCLLLCVCFLCDRSSVVLCYLETCCFQQHMIGSIFVSA